MKHSLAALSALSLLVFPLSALAHENQVFQIGDKQYSFVVGSLNEPMIVDDKSGVDFTVSQLGVPSAAAVADDGDGDDEEAGAPVLGLDKTMKVEISAGDVKKTFDLKPVYGKDGSYSAVFFPTVQTTLSYRFFGTINAVPVDLTFTCNPAGHPVTPEDTSSVKMSDNVTRILKKGAFGCALAKADLGFPENSASINDLKKGGGMDWGLIGFVFGLLGFVIAADTRRKMSKS